MNSKQISLVRNPTAGVLWVRETEFHMCCQSGPAPVYNIAIRTVESSFYDLFFFFRDHIAIKCIFYRNSQNFRLEIQNGIYLLRSHLHRAQWMEELHQMWIDVLWKLSLVF